MKNKVLKIVTVVILLATLTMANFIYVGYGLVSYAASSIATNHQNVEFDAQLKEENILSLLINVKKEGYFNGEITLENSNFTIDTQQSNQYINKIEDSKIVLNQINAGTTAQVDLKIKPVNKEIFDAGLLSAVSKLNLNGKYMDSTQKDITIKASREVKLEYVDNNTVDNIESTTNIITNKIMKVSGEDKRVVQLEVALGLKENNYPIKEMELQMKIPTINNKQPTIVKKIDFNTMTHWDYKYEESAVEIKFTNEPNEQNNILWKKEGNEKVVLTLIYDKDSILDNITLQPEIKVTLYDGKELSTNTVIDKTQLSEEKDAIIQTTASNSESSIYKGKLYSGIDRSYEETTKIAVNLANAEDYIKVAEKATNYVGDDEEASANVVYNKTTIKKEEFDKVLGENGKITITNENGEVLATIDNATQVDENQNIVIDYEGKEPSAIEVKTTAPIKEGDLELVHTKTIKENQNKDLIKKATELNTTIEYGYNTEITNKVESTIKLVESKTEARLEVNKETLSTVVDNTVEMKAILKGNSEQYNLYKNPTIAFELPEEVEEIKVNSVDLIYDNELKVKNYEVTGRTLKVYLEGEQKNYKDLSIEGTVIVVNANINVNKKSATKDSKITMIYQNNEETNSDSKEIRIVAPKDVTAINSIKELNVETIGQEETKKVALARGSKTKQLETEIEIVNNNENAIENVKIIGTFPTKNKENNMDIKLLEGITLEGIDGAKIYYTEKEDATTDVKDSGNAWTEEITDTSKVRKYLIDVPSLEAQSSIKGTYKVEIPELLEYNQSAKQGYTVQYTNSLSKTEGEMKATTIELETGIGPKLETKLTPTVSGSEVASNSTVKNGEVIKYKIEVSNVGSEDLTNVTLQGDVPEGTTLVEPQENYEYTGASYYKELTDKTYNAKIDKIRAGEVITGTYEVRVNAGVESGTKLLNTVQAQYGDVIKKSNESQLLTESGDIRVSVKRVTDRKVDLYESGTVRYFAIIENLANSKSEDVIINTNKSDNIEPSRVVLLTGMKTGENANQDESINSEEIDYRDEMNIGSLGAGEVKVLSYDMSIKKLDSTNKIGFSVIAKEGKSEYKSNRIEENINKVNVALNMTTNTQSQYVKAGDNIEYTITVKNNGTEGVSGLKIIDKIPSSLTVDSVTFDDETIEAYKDINDIEISCDIASQSESTIKISTTVKYSVDRTNAEPITNVAYAEMLGERVATTSEINHIIEANKENTDTDKDEDGKGNEDIANGSKMITGVAWFDENANGQRDDSEKTLSNIKVHLLNTKTNNLVKDTKGNVLEATTNDNGVYVLNNIGSGKYIVVFEYNKTQYALTKYKAENVDESKNSDVMTNELSIENEKQQVASTDIIEINNENVSDINIGLIELKNFNFRLDKYISKILIQNSAGTTVKEYTDATVAKAELDGKKINGTTVIIEYEIKVTNIGEVDGYVRKIVDYMPSDLKFSSELNKDWYQTGTDLYNTSLANEKITAGQSKSVKLTLTKAMTENNTGLINNTAEIAESYNELGIADSKSTPGNRVNGESDYGSADAILSLKTGGEVYIAITIIAIIALGIPTFIIIRKKYIKGDRK